MQSAHTLYVQIFGLRRRISDMKCISCIQLYFARKLHQIVSKSRQPTNGIHCIKYQNFTEFSGLEVLWKCTVSAEFRAIYHKSFHTSKLGEITIFYAVIFSNNVFKSKDLSIALNSRAFSNLHFFISLTLHQDIKMFLRFF